MSPITIYLDSNNVIAFAMVVIAINLLVITIRNW